jgi:ATP-dependent Clp protease ATP-binding subunit ClpC
MFDDEDALVRIDMSEYREQHAVSRLFGAPPGYVGYEEGGQLTEAVRRRPYRVILFDEIEKAHQEVWNSLLQILDDGRLTDGQGHIVDFRNTVLIMTSNLGTKYVSKAGPIGYNLPNIEAEDREAQRNIEKELKKTFRPEFINRIDEIITFSPLSLEDMTNIVDLQMSEVRERMSEHGLMVEITDKAREWLAETGYNPDFGARPLQRAIQKHLESPLSLKLLGGEFSNGDTIIVDVNPEEDELEFSVKGKKRKKSAPKEVEVEA